MLQPIPPGALQTSGTAPQPPQAMSRPDPAAPVSVEAGESAASREMPQAGASMQVEPVSKALEAINASMQAWSTGMRFDLDEDSQRIVITIVDNASGEVLRTVPTEAVLRVARMITQLQGGAVDTHA